MKYIFTTILLFILLIIPFVSRAETEVYIYPVATGEATYTGGDSIKGQFTIHNVLNKRQADITYEITLSKGDTFNESITLDRKTFEPLFLQI